MQLPVRLGCNGVQFRDRIRPKSQVGGFEVFTEMFYGRGARYEQNVRRALEQPRESDERLQRIVAWEQAARYAAERARETFDRAWEEARDAVQPSRPSGEHEPAPEVRPST